MTTTPASSPTAEQADEPIGILGGSGLYRFLDDAHPVEVSTPFGPPSEPPVVGTVGGRPVAFIPRHGKDHRFPPHRVNYRANLWALRAIGVRQVLGPCAVGSMLTELGPGTLVVPDQVIDRTWGREHSVYADIGTVVHVGFADPYCAHGRSAVLRAAESVGWAARDGATLVVINGPRFSTRAESRWHASTGADLVGMTGMPEASIARELALCYTSIALVTDLDAGFEEGAGVTHAEVLQAFAGNVERLKTVLAAAVTRMPLTQPDCGCRKALDGLPLPFELP